MDRVHDVNYYSGSFISLVVAVIHSRLTYMSDYDCACASNASTSTVQLHPDLRRSQYSTYSIEYCHIIVILTRSQFVVTTTNLSPTKIGQHDTDYRELREITLPPLLLHKPQA